MSRKSKKGALCLVLALMLCLMTGCVGSDYGIIMNEDGSGTFKMSYMIEKSVYNYLLSMQEQDKKGEDSFKEFKDAGFEEGTQFVNDVSYETFSKSVSFTSVEELTKLLTNESYLSEKFVGEAGKKEEMDSFGEKNFQGVSIDKNSFQVVYHQTAENLDLSNGGDTGMVFLMSITYSKEINYTNGKLSDDKKTASWQIDLDKFKGDKLLVASTIGSDAFKKDTVKPVVKGVKNGAFYKKSVELNVKDNIGFQTLKLNKKTIDYQYTVEKDGKYTLVAKDFAGNTVTRSFTIDTKAPTVKGVANYATYKKAKKITFSDKNGIKSATLNGKKVKSGVTVKKSGKYVLKVTDKAGNKKTVRFSIKK